ncbi:hypothetical protein JVX90_13845 [Gordonia sp. PDNC005]|uniref:hypothetical protein n=1 Tax=Gordonia sp. PDNC005 TaxID=2811424 RepID=UPI00196638BB|nr:hypothetical protein [Gordonia sp. PDNC005]QRY61495.1 hypothetical protein JVX90_13845 [Gordonia sp. PDNC005]
MSGKDHSRVNLSIWGDDDWLDLPWMAQHLYLALWTSPDLSYCGSATWHPGRIATLADDLTVDMVEAAAAVLSQRLFLLVDEQTGEYLLRSWIKHDGLWRIPNMAVSMANARASMSSRALRGVVVHEVAKIRVKHPDSSSWTRDAVASMLDQKAVDPGSLPVFNPGGNPDQNGMDNPRSNPSANGWANPSANPTSNTGVTENLTHTANPRSNPGPTPAPAPTTEQQEGVTLSGDVTSRAGEAGRPSPRCPLHADEIVVPPCGACRDARLSAEAWDAAQVDVERERRAAEREAIAVAAVAERRACGMCDIETGYANGRVCNHNAEQAATNAAGIADVRAAFVRASSRKTETADA